MPLVTHFPIGASSPEWYFSTHQSARAVLFKKMGAGVGLALKANHSQDANQQKGELYKCDLKTSLPLESPKSKYNITTECYRLSNLFIVQVFAFPLQIKETREIETFKTKKSSHFTWNLNYNLGHLRKRMAGCIILIADCLKKYKAHKSKKPWYLSILLGTRVTFVYVFESFSQYIHINYQSPSVSECT